MGIELESVESGELPLDVVIGILSRIPVKTLFRFKSVCTTWDAMIPTSPYLVSTHLKNYTRASLLCSYHERGTRLVSLSPEDDDPAQPPTTLATGDLARLVCGAGNGVFLLGGPNVFQSGHYHLWNPATREIRQLPDPPLALELDPSHPLHHYLWHYSDYCGIGLTDDDIKVVLIRNYVYRGPRYNVLPPDLGYPSPVFVYTLRSNCWRELPERYSYQEKRELTHSMFRWCTYFEGFLYRLSMDRHGIFVVAFDMATDVFHKITCPFGAACWSCNLSVYGDSSIALFRQLDSLSVEVWLLSRSGGGWYWMKHSSLDPLPEQLHVQGWWKDDQLVAQTSGPRNDMVLFDMTTQECKLLIPNCMLERWNVYKESLFRIE
ncbi:unnamed protein product [Linum tenue]|uniref:F-box domain-containing protein n=1 Tax=Linum tenue TaxID=586396 RepID=A0AAV0I096_9ROSI|nr:unnamed protein product [Linum tenue]